jgi:beta propeller repeat protein
MRKLLILLSTIFMVLVLAGSASATTDPQPANPVAMATDQSVIGGHQMVYEQNYTDTDYNIYKKDLVTNTITTVTTSTRDDRNPDISGNIVVWQSKAAGGKWQIYWKDTSTANPAALVYSEPTVDQLNPSISGTLVIWQRYWSAADADTGGVLDDYDIVGYDLPSNNYYGNIASSAQFEGFPDLYGITVVYNKYENLGTSGSADWHWQVYKTDFFNPNTGTKISAMFNDQLYPVVSSTGKAAWQEMIGDYDIVWVDDVWAASPSRYYEGTGYHDVSPALSGNILVWRQQWSLGSSDYDLYMKDISNNTNPKISVQMSGYNQLNPAVDSDGYGIFVSYTDTRDGYNRVYWRNMDSKGPTVAITTPAQYAVNLPSNQLFRVYFNEQILAKNLNLIILKTSSGTVIPTTKSISGNVLTITPTIALDEAKYLLLIYSGSLTDYANNNVATQSRTYSVGTSPYVTSTDPVNYAVNVAKNKVITVTFNEPIVAKYLTLIYLKTVIGGILISATKSVSGNVLTVTPTSPLAAGTRYILLIYTFAVTDLAGNPNVNKQFTFTTGTT